MSESYGTDPNYQVNPEGAYGQPPQQPDYPSIENQGNGAENSNKRPRVEEGAVHGGHIDVTILSKMLQIFDKDQLIRMAAEV